MDDDICRMCSHPRKEHEPNGCTALVMTWEHGDTWDEPCGCTVFWAMTGAEYRALRETIGTQAEAAEKLGVAPNTIARREREELMISLETEYAMRWVVQGQPFTREDVEKLRMLSGDLEKMGWVRRGQLTDLADRIEALLPPAGD